MKLVIFGSEGGIGRRLRAAFPDAIGVDRKGSADVVVDLDEADFTRGPVAGLLRGADAVIYLATSADPDAEDREHFQALVNITRLTAACAALGVPRLVLPSSDWADPKPGGPVINSYGHSKRVIEALAAMYGCHPGRRAVAIRFGWVPAHDDEVETAPDWLAANHWTDERLVREVRAALELT